jgi:hypothetical protein
VGKRNAPLWARPLTWGLGPSGKTPVRPGNGPHRPSACRDRSCLRPLCAAYKDGFSDGYDDGFTDGVAACPRPHRGG